MPFPDRCCHGDNLPQYVDIACPSNIFNSLRLTAKRETMEGRMMDAVLAKSQIGVEEYLDLVFDDRPEPDYVDGEVVERALPTPIHSQIQALLIVLFAPLMTRFRLVLLPELRVRVEPRRFRVVDLAVYRDSRPE